MVFNRLCADDPAAAFRFAAEQLTLMPVDAELLEQVTVAAERDDLQEQQLIAIIELAEHLQNIRLLGAQQNRLALAAVAAAFPSDTARAWKLLIHAFDVYPVQIANLDWARRLSVNSQIPDLRQSLEHFAQRAEAGDFPPEIFMELNDIVYAT